MELSREDRIMEKYSEIKAEISVIGWNGVLELYHPDVNVNNPSA